MAKYNSNYIYNKPTEDGGFFWNGATVTKIINITDSVNAHDTYNTLSVKMYTRERIGIIDLLLFNAYYFFTDRFKETDSSSVLAFLSANENARFVDLLSDLFVYSYLSEDITILEKMNQLVELLKTERARFYDFTKLSSMLNVSEIPQIEDDNYALQVATILFDLLGITDYEPRKAISDFMIGATDDLDPAYDWLIPFDLKVDWKSSVIQVMPEAEVTSIEMPGVDGDIVQNTVYKNRLFQLVGFSADGLSKYQKELLKAQIAEVLDVTKHKTKKLTVQSRGTSFDVKYEGQAEITEGPSYVKATIPFRASPYGYETFERELRGIGLINNDGYTDIGTVHKITGPITNPSFELGGQEYTWENTVPEGKILVIDINNISVYLEDALGNKENAMADIKQGTKFKKIPANTSVVLDAKEEVANNITTTWKINLLW